MYNFYNHRRAQCVYIKERGVEEHSVGEVGVGMSTKGERRN